MESTGESFGSAKCEGTRDAKGDWSLCDIWHAVHGVGRVARLEPPSAALDGLLRSTPPQFAALGTIVAVITAAILSPCSRSLIRTRRGVRVRRRRLRGYTASCHRSLHARSRDRWFGAAAAGSRRRLALRSSGRRRAQRVLSLPRLSTGES